MKISPVVCTRNRAPYLVHALRSLAQQNLGRDDYEIIVVDNGSSDNTRSVVADLTREAANIRYFVEPASGLSAARNRGITQAVAPIVAFLDDDAVANPGWLGAILEAFARQPQPACVGGPVDPWWQTPKPAWFPVSFIGCHHKFYGDQPRWYDYPSELPIGCNMAYSKDWLQKAGGFDVRLENYNDETDMLRRLADAGGQFFYQPAARVRHLVAKERISLGWQMRRHYREGLSLAVAATSQNQPSRVRRVAQLGRNVLSIGKRSLRLIISFGPLETRIQTMAGLSTAIGQAVQLTKSLRQP